MKRYLDPKNDLVFKRVFGENSHILRTFLNAVLPLSEGEKIVQLEYLSPEQVPEIPILKYCIVDVRCKDQRGRQFIVEMQMEWSNAFLKRFLFNAGKAYINQLEKGESYEFLEPVYGLCLLNDVFEPEDPDFYHHFKILNVKKPKREIQGLQLVFVEIPKFVSQHPSGQETELEIWLRFLKETGKRDEAPEEIATFGPDVKQALELAQSAAYTRDELENYDRYWDAISTHKSVIQVARSEGLAEGIAEGKAVGIAEGRANALQEALEKLVASGLAMDQAKRILDLV